MEDGGRVYTGEGGREVLKVIRRRRHCCWRCCSTCRCMYVRPRWPPRSIAVAGAGAPAAIDAAAPAAACPPSLIRSFASPLIWLPLLALALPLPLMPLHLPLHVRPRLFTCSPAPSFDRRCWRCSCSCCCLFVCVRLVIGAVVDAAAAVVSALAVAVACCGCVYATCAGLCVRPLLFVSLLSVVFHHQYL
jgi:hypothetical protein